MTSFGTTSPLLQLGSTSVKPATPALGSTPEGAQDASRPTTPAEETALHSSPAAGRTGTQPGTTPAQDNSVDGAQDTSSSAAGQGNTPEGVVHSSPAQDSNGTAVQSSPQPAQTGRTTNEVTTTTADGHTTHSIVPPTGTRLQVTTCVPGSTPIPTTMTLADGTIVPGTKIGQTTYYYDTTMTQWMKTTGHETTPVLPETPAPSSSAANIATSPAQDNSGDGAQDANSSAAAQSSSGTPIPAAPSSSAADNSGGGAATSVQASNSVTNTQTSPAPAAGDSSVGSELGEAAQDASRPATPAEETALHSSPAPSSTPISEGERAPGVVQSSPEQGSSGTPIPAAQDASRPTTPAEETALDSSPLLGSSGTQPVTDTSTPIPAPGDSGGGLGEGAQDSNRTAVQSSPAAGTPVIPVQSSPAAQDANSSAAAQSSSGTPSPEAQDTSSSAAGQGNTPEGVVHSSPAQDSNGTAVQSSPQPAQTGRTTNEVTTTTADGHTTHSIVPPTGTRLQVTTCVPGSTPIPTTMTLADGTIVPGTKIGQTTYYYDTTMTQWMKTTGHETTPVLPETPAPSSSAANIATSPAQDNSGDGAQDANSSAAAQSSSGTPIPAAPSSSAADNSGGGAATSVQASNSVTNTQTSPAPAAGDSSVGSELGEAAQDASRPATPAEETALHSSPAAGRPGTQPVTLAEGAETPSPAPAQPGTTSVQSGSVQQPGIVAVEANHNKSHAEKVVITNSTEISVITDQELLRPEEAVGIIVGACGLMAGVMVVARALKRTTVGRGNLGNSGDLESGGNSLAGSASGSRHGVVESGFQFGDGPSLDNPIPHNDISQPADLLRRRETEQTTISPCDLFNQRPVKPTQFKPVTLTPSFYQ